MWFDSKRNGKMATSLVVQRQHQQGVAHFPLQNKILSVKWWVQLVRHSSRDQEV